MRSCVNAKFKGVYNDSSLRKIDEVAIKVGSQSRLNLRYVYSELKVRTSGIMFTVNDDTTPVDTLNLPNVSSEADEVLKNFSGDGYVFVNKAAFFRVYAQSKNLDIEFSQFAGGILSSVRLNNFEYQGTVNLSSMPSTITNFGMWGNGFNPDFSNALNLETFSLYNVEFDFLDLAIAQIAKGRHSATINSVSDIKWGNAKFNGNSLPLDYYTLYWEQQGNDHVVSVKQRDAETPLYTVTI